MSVPPYPYPFLPVLMPMWHVVAFILGACIGSFLNVCIWRIPRDESVIMPPSHCPKCDYEIPLYDNIPLLSWLILRGKCRKCHAPISIRYFLVELLTGCLFYGVWLRVVLYHAPLTLLLPYFLVTMLVVTTIFIDAEHYIIPNETTYPVMFIGIGLSFAFPEIMGQTSRWGALTFSCAGVVGGIVGLGLFAIIGTLVFKKEALGWGDVKYLGAIGACLGLPAVFFTVLIGSMAGAFAGLLVIIFKKGKLKTAIPFGPYLAGASYLWILAGPEMMFSWMRWIRAISKGLIGN
jgi:leader peptidase (prepilin peptidase)/N-methyltransferase